MPGSATRDTERARRLERLRVRGVRGGVIAPHRAMVGLPWSTGRLAGTVTLAAGGLAAVLGVLPWLGRAWGLAFALARDALPIHAPLGDQLYTFFGRLTIALPVLAAETPLPDSRVLWIAGAATALVLLASFLLPVRFLPLSYFLRLLAFFQTTAILFFALVEPFRFPYRLQDHVQLLLLAGLVILALVPVLLGFTLHVFDLPLWKKGILTVLVLGHLALFVPLKALVHTWLVVHGTAVVMPVLFLLFGLLLDVLVFVAFFGWALSWRGALDQGDELPPVHIPGGRA